MLKSVKVRDYMTTNLIVLHPDTELFEAIDKMLKYNVSGASVVDKKGHLMGMLSELDCLKSIVSGSYYDYESLGGTVSEYMTTEVDTLDAEADILTAADQFASKHRRRFPVIEGTKLIGQISRSDVLRAVRDFVSPEQIINKSA